NAQTSAARGGGTTSLCANPNRPDGAAILSGQERGTPAKPAEPREEDSDAGDNDGNYTIRPRGLIPASSSTAGCGKPHVRWCGSPGRSNIPSGRPDQGVAELNQMK